MPHRRPVVGGTQLHRRVQGRSQPGPHRRLHGALFRVHGPHGARGGMELLLGQAPPGRRDLVLLDGPVIFELDLDEGVGVRLGRYGDRFELVQGPAPELATVLVFLVRVCSVTRYDPYLTFSDNCNERCVRT